MPTIGRITVFFVSFGLACSMFLDACELDCETLLLQNKMFSPFPLSFSVSKGIAFECSSKQGALKWSVEKSH